MQQKHLHFLVFTSPIEIPTRLFFDLQDLAFTARHQVSAKLDALVKSKSVVQVTEFSKPKQGFFLSNKRWTDSIFNHFFEA